jgi:hypothetical protein
MRKFLVSGIAAFILLSPPAGAAGLGGLGTLAKTILGGKSVLKKAETKCGTGFALTNQENTTITTAVAAAKKVLPASQFLALETSAQNDANTQAQSATFCPETKAKKKGIMSKIGDAGKKILGAKILGL